MKRGAIIILEDGVPKHHHREVILHENVLAKLKNDGDSVEISPLAVKYKNKWKK